MAKGKRKDADALRRVLFFVYGLLMLWLLFGQRVDSLGQGRPYLEQLQSNLNLQPMQTLRLLWNLAQRENGDYLVRFAVINLVGNVLMFVPLGYFLPRLHPDLRGFFRTAAVATGIIVAVELFQLFSMLGSCDVDDLILNTAGTVVGYILFKIFHK